MPEQISDAQLAANRENAKLSTGPTSDAGKARSSLNAVKTGLTGRTVLLPTEDAELYQKHVARHFADLTPATEEESTLAQFIADGQWRLLRIAPLEYSVQAIGRDKFADLVAHEKDPLRREGLLQGYIFLNLRKELNNIALQERRLRNQIETDRTKLQTLQKARLDQETAAAQKRQVSMQRAVEMAQKAKQQNIAFNPAEFGFLFSTGEISLYASKIEAHMKIAGVVPNVDRVLAAAA
jgi:hypothetical protein